MFEDPCKESYYTLSKSYLISSIANSFTPWFKLIARDFLFGWWDELHKRRAENGVVVAKSLAGVADGSKVIKMT